MTPREFESVARKLMSSHFGAELRARKFPDHPKAFDLVSADGQIVGDAKFFSMVRGSRIPPAKWSVISEHIWLLERTPAKTKFLVFGNDRRVPTGWLKRWGTYLGGDIQFYFINEEGRIEQLATDQRLEA